MNDEATTDETVGTRLKALREDAGLSQRALARLADVTPETVARLEGDRSPPRTGTLRKLAASLGVPPEALAGGRPAADKAAGDLPPAVRSALAAGGVAPGPAGYDAATLFAAVAARGWRATVEELAPSRGGRYRYHAMVFGLGAGGSPTHASGRGRGATEEEALAAALARLLERTG